ASEALPGALQERARHIMRSELKGKQEKIDIFLVAWEDEDELSTRILPHSSRKQQAATADLTLRYGARALTVGPKHRRAVLGREAGCDIIVSGSLISRQHASVELRSGKYVLSDHSANGTYVCFSDGQEVFVAREEVTLQGRGSISLGQSCSEEDAQIIEYILEAVKAHEDVR
ncbi:MAG TPA: FHA domain-containing protein, partial [Gallionella sp.]